MAPLKFVIKVSENELVYRAYCSVVLKKYTELYGIIVLYSIMSCYTKMCNSSNLVYIYSVIFSIPEGASVIQAISPMGINRLNSSFVSLLSNKAWDEHTYRQ